jgi:hypothetical protein
MKLLEYKPMKQLEHRPLTADFYVPLADFNRMLKDAISRGDIDADLLIHGFRFSDTKAVLQEV